MAWSDEDIRWMRHAIELARKGNATPAAMVSAASSCATAR